MELQLSKPLVFIDIEATGLDLDKDRIIELALVKLNTDGSREIKSNRYNPGMHIPPASTEIHQITDDDVKDMPLFSQHALGIMNFLAGCDIAGFNSNKYDVPLLYNELTRCGYELPYKEMCLIDVGNIFKIKEPRTLEAAVNYYCDRNHEGAHGAQADVLATIDVFIMQLEKYDLPTDMRALELLSNHDNPILDISGKFTTNKEGIICLTFGKYRGEPARDHIDFLEWMLRSNFPKDTLDLAYRIVEDSKNVPCDNDDLPF